MDHAFNLARAHEGNDRIIPGVRIECEAVRTLRLPYIGYPDARPYKIRTSYAPSATSYSNYGMASSSVLVHIQSSKFRNDNVAILKPRPLSQSTESMNEPPT